MPGPLLSPPISSSQRIGKVLPPARSEASEKMRTEAAQQLLIPKDKFDERISNCPNENLTKEAYFWAHFLLGQQKNAAINLISIGKIIDISLEGSGPIGEIIGTYPNLQRTLQNFEKLKRWNDQKQVFSLINTKDLLLSLLKLFLDKEDVHLLQWADVSEQNFNNFYTKYNTVKAKRSEIEQELATEEKDLLRLKKERKSVADEYELEKINTKIAYAAESISRTHRLIEINQLQLEIMEKKISIFQHFLTKNANTSYIDKLQTIILRQLAPQITELKAWDFFGRRCIKVATEITLLIKKINNANLTETQKGTLIRDLKTIIKETKSELTKYQYLLEKQTPSIDEIDKET